MKQKYAFWICKLSCTCVIIQSECKHNHKPGNLFWKIWYIHLLIFRHQTQTTGTRKWALHELFLPAPASAVQSPTDSQLQEQLLLQSKQGTNHSPLTTQQLSPPLFFRAAQTVVPELSIADSMASGSKNWVLCSHFNELSIPSPDLCFSWIQLGATGWTFKCLWNSKPCT